MRARWLVVPAVAAVGAVVVFTVAGFTVGGGAAFLALSSAGASTRSCQAGQATDPGTPAVAHLDPEQTRNAAVIVATGRTMGVPQRGWVIAVATAMQESTLHNIRHGDTAGPDSTGLFQQRDPWGPRAVREDPAGAARLFYQALLKVGGWETMPLYVAAQTVQRSGFPYYYARHETAAQDAVAALTGVVVASPTCRPTATASGQWALPIPADRIEKAAGEHHSGGPGSPAVDLPLRPGERQPVYAMVAGIARPMEEPKGCGHGVYVIAGGDQWLYCHLSEQAVTEPRPVAAGDQIGISGWSGFVDPPGPGGAHLHVQLFHDGRFTCLQPAIDALRAGGVPPAVSALPQPPGNTCLAAWAAVVARSA